MGAYFTLESIPCNSEPNFHSLRTRLVAAVNARLQNGEFTERGLAKILGISQPQMHNVLKGRRKLQWELADRVLADLGIKLRDLWAEEELAACAQQERIPGQMYSPHRPAEPSAPAVARKQPSYEIRVRRSHRTAAI
jgi:predicted XRE-type DNA-binding protein